MMDKLLDNKIKKFLMYVVLSFLLLLGCNPTVKTVGPFSSISIEKSKRNGTFLWEYKPIKIKIFDSIDFEILEAFTEKQYRYNSYKDLSFKIDSVNGQVIIKLKNKLSDLKYFDVWTVDGFYSSGPNNLTKKFTGKLPEDTLLIKILKVDINEEGSAGKEDGKEIGAFRLIRK